MIVLDTDIVSLIFRRESAERQRILTRIDAARDAEPVVTSIITYEEQIRGWFKLLSEARNLKQEVEAYQRLGVHLNNYKRLTVIDFDDRAAVELQELRRLKIRLGTMDLKIAAIARARDATLWTRNLRDFQKVPGLRLENPAL